MNPHPASAKSSCRTARGRCSGTSRREVRGPGAAERAPGPPDWRRAEMVTGGEGRYRLDDLSFLIKKETIAF